MVFKKKLLLLAVLSVTLLLVLGLFYSKNNSSISMKNEPIENMKLIVNKLCSEEFEGRLIGSKGNILTEKYINSIYSAIKLEPVLEKDFYHTYSYDPNLVTREEGKDSVETTANNIIGKISGTNSNKAIILSAHFDHLGKRKGDIYKGAVDNASGIATMIQLALLLKNDSSSNAFKYDIVFAAFNGEEFGLTGSENFANKISDLYDDVININIDSIGYKDGGDVALFNTFKKPNEYKKINANEEYIKLTNNIKSSFNKNGVSATKKDLGVGSDDFYFQKKDYTSISISEDNIRRIIHTPNDTTEVIDYNRLERVVNSVRDFINNHIDSFD